MGSAGNQPHSACDLMRGGCRGLAPSLRWRGCLLAIVCESFDFADPSRSLAVVYTSLSAYADKLLLSACCKSLQLLTDRSGSLILAFVLANLCRFMLIFPDQFEEVQRFESPPLSMGGPGEYFSIDMVQCDGTS